MKCRAAVLSLLCLVGAAGLLGIAGCRTLQVVDETGRAVPGAEVRIHSPSFGDEPLGTTNRHGRISWFWPAYLNASSAHSSKDGKYGAVSVEADPFLIILKDPADYLGDSADYKGNVPLILPLPVEEPGQ